MLNQFFCTAQIQPGITRLSLSRVLLAALSLLCCGSCDEPKANRVLSSGPSTPFVDTTFLQEYHEAWKISADGPANDVRSIAVDENMDVWAATAAGVFVKRNNDRYWSRVFDEEESGPSFSVLRDNDGNIWISTWSGVFRANGLEIEQMHGLSGPVAKLCSAKEGIYALGPRGVWLYGPSGWQKKDAPVAQSVRDAVSDESGGVWIGTDVGLYHWQDDSTRHYAGVEHTISAYVRGLALDDSGKLWAAGLGGVSILSKANPVRKLLTSDGLPSIQVNAVRRSPDGVMWVGTDRGLVRYYPDSTHSLLFSRRWLLQDKVNDIAFDRDGNAWVATTGGVSAIKRKPMTLHGKARYFYDVLMRRHIREPWIAGQCKLPVPGDTTEWLPDDDDNDGEYTGNYLAMESFRYATTGDPQAKENARKAFRFLKYLREITGKDGFFARTIVPADWTEVDDGNRHYSQKELAAELIKEPRFKPVEVRWHRSADGKWMWKGDTSSDEMGGHMFGYYFYYELAADEADKKEVRDQVVNIVDGLIANDYNLVDIDGTPTRWGVWSPSLLNQHPEWMPDRSLNSMELLSFVKLASHVTGERKYEDTYRNLIEKHGYLENMANIPSQNPGWFIYFDVMLAAYQYPILLRCEQDPELRAFYERHIDAWFQKYRHDRNPLINFIYCYSRKKTEEVGASVDFLRETPLDLVDWPIDHTLREDVKLVRYPVLDDLQVDELPPPAIRATIRWDKNPYLAVSGNPSVEREPVFWLLPYWMGRYLGAIQAPEGLN